MRSLLFALTILASLAPISASAADKPTVLLDWFVNPDHAPLVVGLLYTSPTPRDRP